MLNKYIKLSNLGKCLLWHFNDIPTIFEYGHWYCVPINDNMEIQ